ncbi:MAG TPA: (Fe-S)-binding protein [bacterium]|nr:(Fe-S)-binding protein [bacterium]
MEHVVLTPSANPVIKVIFIVLFIAALAVFAKRVLFLFNCLKLGASDPRPRTNDITERIIGVIKLVFGQQRVVMFIGGIGHFIIFWGFLMIGFVTMELWTNALFPSVSFWKLIPGFNIVGLIVDLISLAVIFAIVISLLRRFIIKPVRLKGPLSGTIDAVIILGLITALIITYFMMTGIHINQGEIPAAWAPISNLFAGFMPDPHTSEASAKTVFAIAWWIHVIDLFIFIAYIPHSKHLHLLGAIPNIFLRDLGPTGVVNKMDLEDETLETFGIDRVEQFTWKQLLDSYACTECGRCQEACPAFNTDKPLSPKTLTHELKEHLFERGAVIIKEGPITDENMETLMEKYDVLKKNLIGDVFSEDFIWACTSCQACQTVCPVMIEHTELIFDMRRYLVLTESKMSPEVQLTLRNMEKNSNPWGIGQHKRAEWAEGLEIPTFAEKPDAEYLFYVGCSASYDEDNKAIAISTAKVLKQAGVDFAILGEEEMCCGETARRIGNEYLSMAMMEANVEVFKAYNIKKIITVCPHGYNSFKCDYPQYGGDYEVWHHTEFISKLIDEGKLKLSSKFDGGKITWHDSCYLGRYNNIYSEPRNVIKKATGSDPVEMSKHHKLSFCCGAGGGRMWMEEDLGSRINNTRAKMAVDVNADIMVTACPFCRTMFVDGMKDLEKEDIKVMDISQIVEKSL